MGDVIRLNKELDFDMNNDNPQEADDIIAMSQELLLSTRRDIEEKRTISVPFTEMATLGAGVASLLPAFRTVTQTTTFNAEGLHRVANMTPGGVMKLAKDGTAWGSFKTADGVSKMAKLQEVGSISAERKAVAAINPATMMMAVALFSIEKQLGHISENIDKISESLESEKEADIKAALTMLNTIMVEYKHNWNNERFIDANYTKILDIQQTAYKRMDTYEGKITKLVSGKSKLPLKAKNDSLLKELEKAFAYYRLSLYTFAMASFLKVMLGENYAEEYIQEVKTAVETQAMNYRTLYTHCSMMLEKLVDKSIEQNILQGAGFVGKKAGELIGSIPIIRDGFVDEVLQEGGDKLEKSASRMIDDTLVSFSQMSNPGISVFTEKMNDMIQIYNHTEVICFDQDRLWLVGE